jgi:hypothetical protein
VPGSPDVVTNAEEILILCGEMEPSAHRDPEG